MSELIEQLILQTGISEQQARQVAQFLKDNALQMPAWLAATIVPAWLNGKHGGLLID